MYKMFEYLLIPYGITGKHRYFQHMLSGIFITTFSTVFLYFVLSFSRTDTYSTLICKILALIEHIFHMISYLYVKHQAQLIIELNQELYEYYDKYGIVYNKRQNILYVIIYTVFLSFRVYIVFSDRIID